MSELDDLHRRLEELNRGALPPRAKPPTPAGRAPPPAAQPIRYARELLRRQPPRPEPNLPPGRPAALAEAGGQEVRAPNGATAHLIARRISELHARWRPLGEQFGRALDDAGSPVSRWLARELRTARLRAEDVIFVDLETTGLGGAPVFLIGSMGFEDGALVARQYFAADYSQERGILSLFLQAAADKRLLVSFNGKSFDVPCLRVRSAANAIPFAFDPDHLDLLHVSRRIWGGRVPDCRLQTLEARICGRAARHGDIPGQLIPDAYHAFVRTGNAAQMLEVIRHNLLDLITLADLLLRVPAGAGGS